MTKHTQFIKLYQEIERDLTRIINSYDYSLLLEDEEKLMIKQIIAAEDTDPDDFDEELIDRGIKAAQLFKDKLWRGWIELLDLQIEENRHESYLAYLENYNLI